MTLNEQKNVQLGSLVSISVFPKTVLYSPYGIIPIINHYVAYGFYNIEDFFNEHNSMYQNTELIKTIEEPFLGVVLKMEDYKIIKPHKTYKVHMFYKIFINGIKENYWFSEDDTKLI